MREERELALAMACIRIDEDRVRIASAFATEPPCCRGRSRGRRHLAHRNVPSPVEIRACTSERTGNGLTAAVAESKARAGRSRDGRRQRCRRIDPVALVAYSVEANDVWAADLCFFRAAREFGQDEGFSEPRDLRISIREQALRSAKSPSPGYTLRSHRVDRLHRLAAGEIDVGVSAFTEQIGRRWRESQRRCAAGVE